MGWTLDPLHDRVVVEILEQEEKSPGGIVIPETTRGHAMRGKVVAVGPGRRNDEGKILEPVVKVGQQVIFAQHAGLEVAIRGKTVYVVYEHEILAVLREDGK